MKQFHSKTINDTEAIGAQLLRQFQLPACVYLVGEMGVGKTSLCQAIIRAAGYEGAVTSPTYNLIQEYPVQNGTIYHMDLYRVEDPAEVEYLGLDDLWHSRSLFLIEWPSRGHGYLPLADHVISITYDADNSENENPDNPRIITLEGS